MVERCRRRGKIIREGEKCYVSRIGSVTYCVSCRKVLVKVFEKRGAWCGLLHDRWYAYEWLRIISW